MRNVIEIGRVAAELIPIVDFQNGGRRRPLDFICKISLFLTKFTLAVISALALKFDKDRTTHGRVIAYFRFSKWRPSAILDLVDVIADHP